ncbi:AraC family transcriptional regulator [Jiangella rhizosphaerae]|uniref:AraC family transcriptional regulator n=1 Tax=Jiangella rhizosphaerae TaxID=2293569 RepID=A0A418KVC0_9ACTN|nr:AraC family transcriptional regulator [Jiangella rhizosphaerae]RIQ33682.1 AraC family transcriptional regulator [Jiangella rhizosphaerae]
MDALADVLDGVRARSAEFCRAVLEPPWALRIADGAALALATVLRGHAWIVPDDAEPVLIRPGEVAVIRGPRPYTVGDDPHTAPSIEVLAGGRLRTVDGADLSADALGRRPGEPDPEGAAVVASGTYQVGGDIGARLLTALPAVVHVPRDPAVAPVLGLLAAELERDEPGQQVVLDRLLDLALIATLRAWFARPEAAAPGWYRALGDPVVGPALRLVHGDPAHPWSIAELAARTGASRAAFARRFAGLVGVPPMTYVTGWRLTLAADLLRQTDATVDTIARRVGYANAFALSVAFKRVRGVTPRHHRAAPASAGHLTLGGGAGPGWTHGDG